MEPEACNRAGVGLRPCCRQHIHKAAMPIRSEVERKRRLKGQKKTKDAIENP